ncbi:indolepyruvate ferredoxin oxidoreductase subunit alpha [Wukongibacter baidiensis]|uniref:indolepyruvate ferredoxin oxidoreductase subunit alpha n=1 Tax=Wukongibacter baidiensis TaxID=1723361 RepID=UPI003D7FF168
MKRLMLGNEAIARGAYEAGVTIATAYPGTPSTEITEFVAKYDEIYAEWAPNEKVAMESAIGASFGGARTIVSMKHVGLNVAADPLFTVSYTGVNGGLVILVADDPGMHSSQNEQDTRMIARAANIPVLEPGDSNESKNFMKLAFELSEKYDTPIIVRLTTRVSHSQSIVSLKDREEVSLRPYVKDFNKYVMMPGMARKRHVVVEKRIDTIAQDANDFSFNTVEYNEKKIGIISSGVVYNYAKEAIPQASFLKLGMVHPLPIDKIKTFARGVEKLYVLEELEPVIEEQLKSLGIDVIGKEIFSKQGEYSVNIIREKILGEKNNLKTAGIELPLRPPVMCPGCPHRGAYYTMNLLGLHVTGDIGCYTLGALPPLESMDACVCMGASIGMAHGMAKARGNDFAKKVVAVIGDSTFIHSGITGLVNIVYNQGVSTVVILDNSTTGMTGHQEHPGTGKTLKGEDAPILNLVELSKSIGIKNVQVVDAFDLEGLKKILREETEKMEPSVVIVQRPCALLDKTVKPTFEIFEEKCVQCGMCLKLGCPAIEKENDRIIINDALCNGCGLCSNVCKLDAIGKAGA